jgi:hypothetical protein
LLRSVAFCLAALSCAAAWAQSPLAVLRGTIAAVAVDGGGLTFKTRGGESAHVALGPKTVYVDVVKASAADLKPNAFIGVAAVPDPGGGLKALEVHIFPEAMRGTGEGFRPFDLAPHSSMTNGALNVKVGGVAGDTLTVAYKGGSQTIRLPADAPIVAFAPGDKADVKPGAAAIVRGVKAADGAVTAAFVLVGKDGVVPPM